MQNGEIRGYYIGYKKFNVSAPYMYITKSLEDDSFYESEFFDDDTVLELEMNNLEKFTKYAIHVQAFNSKGAGPKSEDIGVLTLEDGKR